MRCTVLYFAQARELAGMEGTIMDFADGSTVDTAMQDILRAVPALSPLRGRMSVAVDERYAPPATPLRDGCTIALIPPVSGG